LIEFRVKITDMTVQKSDGWFGLITNPSTHAGCMKSITEVISRPTRLLEDVASLIHKRGLRMGYHHIPGQEL
jgi:hypothetical protein